MHSEDYLALAAWRRDVAMLYGRVRTGSDPETSSKEFRAARNLLFAEHGQTPLEEHQRQSFSGLNYFPYELGMRVQGSVVESEKETFAMELPNEGVLRFTRFARVHFVLNQHSLSLALYWVEGYGGGLFMPFRDKSNGRSTYGGGRYLYDGIKGADLGAQEEQILLDFNFAYNPSCAYNDNWVCPLAPVENRLDIEVLAGEKAFVDWE